MDRESDEKLLVKYIWQLKVEMKKLNSMPRNFVRGILFGLGSAIGASIVAAIVLTVLAKIIHTFNIQIPINK